MNVFFRKETGFLAPSRVVIFVPGQVLHDQSVGYLQISVIGAKDAPDYEVQMRPVRARDVPKDVSSRDISGALDSRALQAFEIAGWLADQVR